jgi:hypothetical protein
VQVAVSCAGVRPPTKYGREGARACLHTQTVPLMVYGASIRPQTTFISEGTLGFLQIQTVRVAVEWCWCEIPSTKYGVEGTPGFLHIQTVPVAVSGAGVRPPNEIRMGRNPGTPSHSSAAGSSEWCRC